MIPTKDAAIAITICIPVPAPSAMSLPKPGMRVTEPIGAKGEGWGGGVRSGGPGVLETECREEKSWQQLQPSPPRPATECQPEVSLARKHPLHHAAPSGGQLQVQGMSPQADTDAQTAPLLEQLVLQV